MLEFLRDQDWWPGEETEDTSQTTETIGHQDLYAPASGDLLPITEVADAVFSQKMMGDGFAIQPLTEGQVFSPVAGRVEKIHTHEHAVSIVTKRGLEFLIHLGLNTVELPGYPFKALVAEGDQVEVGTPLAEMDLDAIRRHHYKTTIVVVLTNMDVGAEVQLLRAENDQVKAKEKIAELKVLEEG
ncbi:PTS sugar transporter subunit IIA [Aerococcus kribbianus]|uniref:PTS glucose transporter subunit IIA n=1 Tax=Aerococcus kribbianus TaxID=2999064 RepID=A0A9X3FNG2_9LACT|nr:MULTISPECIES: PTS glucose transporter subunit IIA [unclassified Aerococcus]MCZ0716993.1 PTS glucose transporter subunit IIA [Aerococcus sp. YH-aer221]MCZ0725281.1 PTS glucose transporter subunit IIA [Aerococcus sp. YH-aer222]